MKNTNYHHKPTSAEVATSAEIIAKLPFAAGLIDEMFLRNRAREINPRTGKAWIAKQSQNLYAVEPTIMGLLEWFATKAGDGLPAHFDSMQAMENSFLRIPRAFTRWALKNGAGEAAMNGSRINPRPIIAKLAEVAERVATGHGSTTDNGRALDLNTERARLAHAQANEKERENAIANKQIYRLEVVEEMVWTGILSPVFNDLTALEKKAHRLKYDPAVCVEIVRDDFPRVRANVASSQSSSGQRITKTPQ